MERLARCLAALALAGVLCGCFWFTRQPVSKAPTATAFSAPTRTLTPTLLPTWAHQAKKTETAPPTAPPTASATPAATPSATSSPLATDTSALPTATQVPAIATAPPPSPTPTFFTENESPAASLYSTRERLGLAFNPGFGALSEYPLERLPFGWYSDWRVREYPEQPDGIEFVQLVRVSKSQYPPDWERLAAAIAANPGAIWLIGNEPECIYQDARTPTEYASIYHDCYIFIKERDPSARVGAGGVVEPTPLRLQWLDQVLAAYHSAYGERLPTDVWHIHNQILQEKRNEYGCDIPVGLSQDAGRLYPWWENDSMEHFRDHIWDFRRWMGERGERDKPLIVSEYGVLMPNDHFDEIGGSGSGERRVKEFMSGSMKFMLTARDEELGCPSDGNRLVQRWLWFSLNNPSWEQNQAANQGFNGNLCDPYTRELTPYGEHYAQLAAELIAGNVSD